MWVLMGCRSCQSGQGRDRPYARPVVSGELEGLPLARATHHRVAHLRADGDWLARAWADPATRVLVVTDGQVPVDETGEALAFSTPSDVAADERLLLGVVEGRAHFAVSGDRPPNGSRSAGVREIGPLVNDRDAGLLVHAVALTNWHLAHPYCSRCGAPTELAEAGQSRRCTACAAVHFPRSDPAVIMLVTDSDDRCLLGHQATWPEGRYSTLAGFVEPGETPERAVVREVAEEVGVEVAHPRYAGAQPWPFPSSLMLGYFAQALSTEITVDGVEITEAQWFSRSDLRTAVEGGLVRLPGAVSIARSLVERWYGSPLAGAW